MDLTYRRQIAIASGINVLAGIWLIVSPWALAYSSHYRLTDDAPLLGVLVAGIAGNRFVTRRTAGWIGLVFTSMLGAWLMISPWFLRDYGSAAAVWNTIPAGGR